MNDVVLMHVVLSSQHEICVTSDAGQAITTNIVLKTKMAADYETGEQRHALTSKIKTLENKINVSEYEIVQTVNVYYEL